MAWIRCLVLALLIISVESEACIERPKAVSFSETSYEKSLAISYGLNCRVNVSIETETGDLFDLSEGTGEESNQLCLRINKGRDYQQICGAKLLQLEKSNKEKLTIRNKKGEAVAFLSITPSKIQILSWNRGPSRSKPFIELGIDDLEKQWKIRAMQNESIQVGEGTLESKQCTRSLGSPSSDQVVDLRGKSISTSGAGCTSGMVVSDYRPAGHNGRGKKGSAR